MVSQALRGTKTGALPEACLKRVMRPLPCMERPEESGRIEPDEPRGSYTAVDAGVFVGRALGRGWQD